MQYKSASSSGCCRQLVAQKRVYNFQFNDVTYIIFYVNYKNLSAGITVVMENVLFAKAETMRK